MKLSNATAVQTMLMGFASLANEAARKAGPTVDPFRITIRFALPAQGRMNLRAVAVIREAAN